MAVAAAMTDGQGNLLPIPERRSMTKKLLRKVEPAERSLCRQQRTALLIRRRMCALVVERSFASRIDQQAPYVAQHTAMRFTDSVRGHVRVAIKMVCVRASTHLLVGLQERELKMLRKDQSFEGTVPLRSHVEAERSLVNSGALGKQARRPPAPAPRLCAAVLVCS